jgi:hypothetical protein
VGKLKIYFCFPYRGVGGVSLLFLRIAEYFQCNGLAQCYLVDYFDGFMARNLRSDSGVELSVYNDMGPVVVVPKCSVVVFQSMTPWSIFPGIKPDPHARILFWNCFPFNLIPFLPGLRRQMQDNELLARLILATLLRGYRNKIRKLIALLSSKRALVFMDSPNLLTTKLYLGVTIFDPVYVPIPICLSKNDHFIEMNRDFSRQLRVVWVGRLVDFKFYTLQRALIELNRLQPLLKVSVLVNIVGSGPYRDQLFTEVKNLSNLTFHFIDHISPNKLDEYVVQNTDLLLAMGTSALEGARLGVPTILLDIAHGPVSENYVFSWLYERKGFTLGDVICEENFAPDNNSLLCHIRELIDDFPQVSEMCRNYAKYNHDIKQVAKKLLDAIYSSNCTYGDLANAGLLKRGFLYPVFRMIRNKVIKI